MIRRIAREMVLQSLFQLDFTQAEPEEALQVALEEQDSENADKALPYARLVLEGTAANLAVIDAKINAYATNWDTKRMPGIDRNILRMAVYELFYAEEKQPATIAINEAVELAKIYGTDNSARFINGVLGKMMRDEA